MDNFICVIISTRNSEKYIEKCISSALSQQYSAFEIIFYDAESSDSTFEKALLFDHDPRIKVFRNLKRKYQGENIRNGVLLSKPESIIVTLDGDDWFPHDGVLSRVNQIYNEKKCWMTYGIYQEFPYRDVSHIYKEYSITVRMDKTFREHRWMATHLRTFRRELFLHIKEDDFKDPETGNYVSYAPDLSFQFPMLEMCGVDKSVFVPEVLYIYNVENPNNESKQNQSEISRIEKFLRSKDKYQTLYKL